MNTNTKLAMPFVLTLLAQAAFAHDPALHHTPEPSLASDCSQMKETDMSKMDMNDPVTKAMHEKCKAVIGHDNAHPHGQDDMDMRAHDMHDMKDMKTKTPPSADDKDRK